MKEFVEIKFSELRVETYKEMQDWCKEKFGAGAWWKSQLENERANVRWMGTSMKGNDATVLDQAKFVFRIPGDASHFTLKWAERTASEQTRPDDEP